MLSNMRRAFLAVTFSAIAGVGSLALADHGHGGGHGNWGGGGWSGGRGQVNYGRFGGYGGFNNFWRGGARYYSGYRNYGWPYSYYRNNFYRPYIYGYFGYPYLYSYYNYPTGYYGYPSYYYSYPSDYYVNGADAYYGEAPPAQEYVVSRPVSDVARVEIRLPDPEGTLWVQGQEINSSGTVRKFKSPQLDPSHQYTYTVKAEWHDNGKLVTDQRQVKVQANSLAVVDFNRPTQVGPVAQRAPLPDLPPPQPQPTVE